MIPLLKERIKSYGCTDPSKIGDKNGGVRLDTRGSRIKILIFSLSLLTRSSKHLTKKLALAIKKEINTLVS